jgi:hypothetical protein
MWQIEAMTLLAGWGLGLYHHKKTNSMEELDEFSSSSGKAPREHVASNLDQTGTPKQDRVLYQRASWPDISLAIRNLNMVAPVYVFIIASNIQ